MRKSQRSFCDQESFHKGDFPLGSRGVNEKFVVLRPLAMFGDEIEVPPHIFRHARASKPCSEITGHLFCLKLNAHSSSDSIFGVLLRLLCFVSHRLGFFRRHAEFFGCDLGLLGGLA